MRRALEQAHQFAERDVALDRDDVGAMDHHVGDAALVQAEDVAQHGALDGGKADLVRRRWHRARPADRRGPIPASSRTACGSRGSASCRRPGRSTSPSCTTAGRLRVLRGLSWIGSESGMSVHPLPVRSGSRSAYGSGMPSCARISLFETFHGFGVVVFFVIVADQMQETVDRKMAEMMIERLLFVVGLLARRLIGDRDIAEHARRIVGPPGRSAAAPETTARWSACRCRASCCSACECRNRRSA